MCLAIPGKIIGIKGDMAAVEYGEVVREAKLVDSSFKVGDYVIIQASFVIQKLPEEQALEALELIKKQGEKNGLC